MKPFVVTVEDKAPDGFRAVGITRSTGAPTSTPGLSEGALAPRALRSVDPALAECVLKKSILEELAKLAGDGRLPRDVEDALFGRREPEPA